MYVDAAAGMPEIQQLHSFVGKVFGVIFRSDRRGCIERIREVGPEAFAAEMRKAGCYNRPVKNS